MPSATYIEWNRFLVRSDNVPLARPGIYLFKNLINGKCYVGMSAVAGIASRGKDHSQRTSPKFGNAIRKYGHKNFVFIPLCYWIGPVDRNAMARLEADFIKEYDAVKNGYNVREADTLGGPSGPEFGKIISKTQLEVWKNMSPECKARRLSKLHSPEGKARSKTARQAPESRMKLSASLAAALAKPEVRANRVAALQRPEVKAKRSASQTETWQNPIIRCSRQDGLKRAWSDPATRADRLAIWDDPEKKARMLVGILPETISVEAKAIRTQAIKLSHSRPEVKAKIAVGTKGGRWITNGQQVRRLRKDQPLPDGWRYGRNKEG
jgi:group I intron endonuclease